MGLLASHHDQLCHAGGWWLSMLLLFKAGPSIPLPSQRGPKALKARKHENSFKSTAGSPLEARAPQAASITSNFTFRLMFFQTFLGSPCSHFLSPFSLQMYLCIKGSGRKNCSFRVTAERGLYY